MSVLLRRLGVGGRLALAFGLTSLLLLASTTVGVLAASSLEAAQSEMSTDGQQRRDAQRIRYYISDAQDWQTDALLAATRGDASALDDSSPQLDAFTTATAQARTYIDGIEVQQLPAALRGVVDDLSAAFDDFLAADAALLSDLRADAASGRELASRELEAQSAASVLNVLAAADLLISDFDRQVDASEANGAEVAQQAQITLISVGAITIALSILLALVITRSITVPLRGAVSVLNAMSTGDLTRRTHDDSRDEVGQLGQALDGTAGNLNRLLRTVVESASTLGAAAEELTATSQQMASSAEETAAAAESVSTAAEQVSQSLQSVSAGTEELDISIREIAATTSNGASVVAEAVSIAEGARTTVTQLGDSSAEISEVAAVITDIAQQTRMLALNATIEAARAGEAGKGFAVVAEEVKELARMTSQSSEDIGRRIGAIQTDSAQAVTAIEQIATIITQVDDQQTVTSASVEQQAATTKDIARALAEAATGSSDIARNITDVAMTAQGATQGASKTQSAAGSLSLLSIELQGLVEQFRLEERRSDPPTGE